MKAGKSENKSLFTGVKNNRLHYMREVDGRLEFIPDKEMEEYREKALNDLFLPSSSSSAVSPS